MTISSRLTSGAAGLEAGSELVEGALMTSLLSSARSSRTARPRSAARRASALRHAGDQIISGLDLAVRVLYQFGKSMVGDPSLDPHRPVESLLWHSVLAARSFRGFRTSDRERVSHPRTNRVCNAKRRWEPSRHSPQSQLGCSRKRSCRERALAPDY